MEITFYILKFLILAIWIIGTSLVFYVIFIWVYDEIDHLMFNRRHTKKQRLFKDKLKSKICEESQDNYKPNPILKIIFTNIPFFFAHKTSGRN